MQREKMQRMEGMRSTRPAESHEGRIVRLEKLKAEERNGIRAKEQKEQEGRRMKRKESAAPI